MVFSLLTTLCAYVWPTCSFTDYYVEHAPWEVAQGIQGKHKPQPLHLIGKETPRTEHYPSQALCINDLVQEKLLPILQKSQLLLLLVNL